MLIRFLLLAMFIYGAQAYAQTPQPRIPEPLQHMRGLVISSANVQTGLTFEGGSTNSCTVTNGQPAIYHCSVDNASVEIERLNGQRSVVALKNLVILEPFSQSEDARVSYVFKGVWQEELNGIEVNTVVTVTILVARGRNQFNGFIRLSEFGTSDQILLRAE